jgi:hypothetical protein
MMQVTDRKVITWLAVVLLGFAVVVWPTRYQFERIGLGPSPSVLVRIDRFTGEAEMLTGSGWRPMEEPKSNDAASGLVSLPQIKLVN